jgi:hypothetical protein
MDALVEKLNSKLNQWTPATADQVRFHIAEIIELADNDTLDIGRSRVVEQEVLDIIDGSKTR